MSDKDTEDEMKEHVNKLVRDASLPSKPDSYGQNYKFPEDLTTLTNEEIGQWMSRLGAYRGYASRQLGISEIRRDLLTDALKLKLPDFIAKIEQAKMTKTDRKERALNLPEAVRMRKAINQAGYTFKLYFALVTIYSGQLEILSRDLTRRTHGQV